MSEARTIPFDSHYGQQWAANSLLIEADLADAIQRRALSPKFQPQFDLRTGAGFGVEALARWTLASGKRVAPSVFIPIADSAGCPWIG
jgi:sensor c-di-GMP phosphodiesterase-like protein